LIFLYILQNISHNIGILFNINKIIFKKNYE
jgi:hypothetical protein